MHSPSLTIFLLLTLLNSSLAWPSNTLALQNRGRHEHNDTSNCNSINHTCHQLRKLTQLTELASNQTQLSALVVSGQLDEGKVAEIQQNAAKANAILQAMQANSTLVDECAVVDAHLQVVHECKQMAKLTKFVELGNNQTAMQEIMPKIGNGTRAERFMENFVDATAKLQELQSNATLTGLCKGELNGTTSKDAFK
ncbi:hypothetical protein CC78DRAFT_541892 [Lojkania enalia]|uniref:Uncharacterized protein n=1 Tax=Lojkania enalia TaxID=147567 RepID=A0A9P4N8Y6_9PLEO|nr:hypothetical protein CC78DRAFT_541892 [Didymosphaeria enalia]